MVLIPKAGNQEVGPIGLPKVKPICLINEIVKVFERVLADRIFSWQGEHLESDFSENFDSGEVVRPVMLYFG